LIEVVEIAEAVAGLEREARARGKSSSRDIPVAACMALIS